MNLRHKNKFYLKIILVFLIGIGLFYVYFANQSKLVIPCIFHEITGLYCPGCGITRCLNSIIHLDFYQAFRYNPLVFVLLPFAFGYVIIRINRTRKNQAVSHGKRNDWVWYLLVIVTLLFGILRNVPYFDWLAPTVV